MLTLEPFLKTLLLTLVYSLLGMGVFGFGFFVIRLITPFSLRREIEEDQNIALAIVIGSVLLGLSIIIAAAIHG